MATIFHGNEGLMAEERSRSTTPLWPDYENEDRFLGLPPDLPAEHSRFAIQPCAGYGDLSFDPFLRQNGAAGEQPVVITDEERSAWRRAMQQAVGHLIEFPPLDR
jgi:hypothetical protein